jgi:hypothetical protein
VAIFLQRVVKSGFRAIDVCTVFMTHSVKKVHVAVLTALTALHTAVPWIPNIMHSFIIVPPINL